MRIPIIIQFTFTPKAGTIQRVLILIIRRCAMGISVAERMPLEKAVELLKEDGIEVTGEQAIVILAFLYEIAEIAVEQYLYKPL
jgi:hypothetical protein